MEAAYGFAKISGSVETLIYFPVELTIGCNFFPVIEWKIVNDMRNIISKSGASIVKLSPPPCGNILSITFTWTLETTPR
jgi:hypothetical protein